MLRPGIVIIAEWIVFALSWILAAAWSSPVERRPGASREILYRVLLIAGGIVLAVPAHGYRGPLRLWLVTREQAWGCAIAILLGFAFAWWARIHLGALWSSNVTAKTNHRVIDSGPYAVVRHPIYTGILFAVYATAAAKGTVPGIAGASVITVGLWLKARLEESWLSGQLASDAYRRYRSRVPMLVPFGPRDGPHRF